MVKITKKTNIAKVVGKCPESVEIMMEYGMGCVGCAMAGGESLEEGAKVHGLTDKEISEMIREINKLN